MYDASCSPADFVRSAPAADAACRIASVSMTRIVPRETDRFESRASPETLTARPLQPEAQIAFPPDSLKSASLVAEPLEPTRSGIQAARVALGGGI